jgi:hypothetical protein
VPLSPCFFYHHLMNAAPGTFFLSSLLIQRKTGVCPVHLALSLIVFHHGERYSHDGEGFSSLQHHRRDGLLMVTNDTSTSPLATPRQTVSTQVRWKAETQRRALLQEQEAYRQELRDIADELLLLQESKAKRRQVGAVLRAKMRQVITAQREADTVATLAGGMRGETEAGKAVDEAVSALEQEVDTLEEERVQLAALDWVDMQREEALHARQLALQQLMDANEHQVHEPAPLSPPLAAHGTGKLCPQCGSHNVPAAKFCTKCGHLLQRQHLTEQPPQPLQYQSGAYPRNELGHMQGVPPLSRQYQPRP